MVKILLKKKNNQWKKLKQNYGIYSKRIRNKLYYAMALLEKYLVVKPSKLSGAGKGLFTKKFIPKGTKIVEYKGRIGKWKNIEKNPGENKYIFYVKRDH